MKCFFKLNYFVFFLNLREHFGTQILKEFFTSLLLCFYSSCFLFEFKKLKCDKTFGFSKDYLITHFLPK